MTNEQPIAPEISPIQFPWTEWDYGDDDEDYDDDYEPLYDEDEDESGDVVW